MSKTPKADALRAMREKRTDEALERWADDRRDIAKRALAKAEAKPRKAKRRKR